MGNTRSELSENTTVHDVWWNPTSSTHTNMSTQTDEPQHASNAEFRLELERKHEKRRQLIAEKRQEMMDIRNELDKYKKENEELKSRTTNEANSELKLQLEKLKSTLNGVVARNEELAKENEDLKGIRDERAAIKEENEELALQVEKLKLELKNGEEIVSKNKELRISIAEMQGEVQNMNTELLNIEQERMEYGKHISALKDVVRVTKDMLAIRESQIEELKTKIKSIEELLASKEMKILSDGLREEYEKQLRNIRNLRSLYDERQRLDKKDKDNLQEQLDETKKQVEDEQKKNSELQERVIELEKDNSNKYDSINSLQSNLGLSKAECKELQAEINIINQLFSEILLGFKNTQEIDLNKLIKTLEENHDLLTNMATNEESDSTAAALPKLLLDLINQMNKEDEAIFCDNTESSSQASNQLNSAEEIVETLPKVWKVLMELLSHQNPPLNALFGPSQEPCYKLIETSKGAKLKLSVSQTFIRLKDLILEKKSLERETYRLKHLNTHLESRLQDQEKRLELVSGEVKNTWHVVDKMQRQHQQLHTHEKVLRYELQQKRKVLNELKEDLQYCREKWVEARAKNDTTHSQWKELRKEFADRKKRVNDDFNQSAESGYSDGKDSSEDERGYESDVSEGKHETDAEVEGDQKTDSVQIDDDKRQSVQNEGRLEDTATGSATSSSNEEKLTDNTTNEEAEASGRVITTPTSEHVIKEALTSTTTNNIALDSSILAEASASALVAPIATTSEDVSTALVSGGEIELTLPRRENHVEFGTRRLEDILEAREIRLRRMEEEGRKLVSKVTNTVNRGSMISDRLDSMHESFEESSRSAVKTSALVKIEDSSVTEAQSSIASEAQFSASEEQSSNASKDTCFNDDELKQQSATCEGLLEDQNNVDGQSTQALSDNTQPINDSMRVLTNSNSSPDESTPRQRVRLTVPENSSPNPNPGSVELSPNLDKEVQELFEEMCKFVEQGAGVSEENGNQNEEVGSVLTDSAREERLHRLEEQFDELTTDASRNVVSEENIIRSEVSLDCIEEVTDSEIPQTSDLGTGEKQLLLVEDQPDACDSEAFDKSHSTSTVVNRNLTDETVDGNIQAKLASLIENNTTLEEIFDAPSIQNNEQSTNSLCLSSNLTDTQVATDNPIVEEGIRDDPSTLEISTDEDFEANINQPSDNSSKQVEGSSERPKRTTEEILSRREERLKRLEAQSQLLLAKTKKTTQKSQVVSDKLDELHEIYGEHSTQEPNGQAVHKEKSARMIREEMLVQREARLRRLETQCKKLLAKISERAARRNFEDNKAEIKLGKGNGDDGELAGSRNEKENGQAYSENGADGKKDNICDDTSTLVECEANNANRMPESKIEQISSIISADDNIPPSQSSTCKSRCSECSTETSTNLSTDADASLTQNVSKEIHSSSTTESLQGSTENWDQILELHSYHEAHSVPPGHNSQSHSLQILEDQCKVLLLQVRDSDETVLRRHQITSGILELLPNILGSIQSEIYIMQHVCDASSIESEDLAVAVMDPISRSDEVEELMSLREARFWRLGEQCWELVNAVTEHFNAN